MPNSSLVPNELQICDQRGSVDDDRARNGAAPDD